MRFAEKLAEHFLARQAILERYIDLCPIPCFIVNKEGETIFVNEAYQQAYNVRLDQTDNRQWENLIHPDDRLRYVTAFNTLIAEQRSHLYAKVHTLLHGKPYLSIIRITHVPGNGYIGYVIFLCAHNEHCPVRGVVDEYLVSSGMEIDGPSVYTSGTHC